MGEFLHSNCWHSQHFVDDLGFTIATFQKHVVVSVCPSSVLLMCGTMFNPHPYQIGLRLSCRWLTLTNMKYDHPHLINLRLFG